jgi:hypothetical protein
MPVTGIAQPEKILCYHLAITQVLEQATLEKEFRGTHARGMDLWISGHLAVASQREPDVALSTLLDRAACSRFSS